MFSFVLASTLASLPPSLPSARTQGPIDFERLSVSQAAAIESERRTFRIWISSAEWQVQGCPTFECWPTTEHVLRTVWFKPGIDIGEKSDWLVSGELRIVRQRGYTELRIVEAVKVAAD